MIKKVLFFLILAILTPGVFLAADDGEPTGLRTMSASLDASLRLAGQVQEEADTILEKCDAILEEIARVRVQTRHTS